MALKKSLTDPLNWLLVLLAGAFTYYILAVPYFTELYLKTPQEMTLAEYLVNPAHPRAFKLHALSAPPPSVEVILTGLRVVHVDEDSILLEDPTLSPQPEPVANPGAETSPGSDVQAQTDAAAPAPPAAAPEQQQLAIVQTADEAPPPRNQILIAGDNVDLLGISVGQEVALQVHGLHESPLGWIPQEPELPSDTEEFFSKEELDELDFIKLHTDGQVVRVPYIEVGEMRFAPGVHAPGERFTLDQLSNDTSYIQAVNRLAGGTVDLYNVHIAERITEDRQPLFVVEDPDGRRAKVYYNGRLLSEWRWALDRLSDMNVVVRGTLRRLAPGDLRALEAEGNVQAVMDGYEILSEAS